MVRRGKEGAYVVCGVGLGYVAPFVVHSEVVEEVVEVRDEVSFAVKVQLDVVHVREEVVV